MSSSFENLLRGTNHAARFILPQILLAFLVAVSVVSIPTPFAYMIKAHLVLMAIYYWAVFRPSVAPPFLCFGVGLLMDALAGLPLGLNAVILVAVRWIVTDQRRFLMGQPYTTIWAVFALIAAGAAGLEWAMLSIKEMKLLPVMPAAASVGVALFLFPFITMLLQFTHRFLPGAARAHKR